MYRERFFTIPEWYSSRAKQSNKAVASQAPVQASNAQPGDGDQYRSCCMRGQMINGNEAMCHGP